VINSYEQLGKGKDRDKLGMNSWTRAKTVAKDRQLKAVHQGLILHLA